MTHARSEAGFTLVELLAAVAILGIVIVPLTGAIILGLRTMDQTSHRYAASNDAQVLTRYLPPDVQSASTGSATSFTSCSGTSNRKLQLTLNADGGTRTVQYWVRSVSTGGYELVRSIWNVNVACASGPAPKSTVLARNIANATNVQAEQLTPLVPMGFKIRVTEAPAQNESSGYTFTVTGRKRST